MIRLAQLVAVALALALTGNFALGQGDSRFSGPAGKPVPRTDWNSQIAHEQHVDKAEKGGIDIYLLGRAQPCGVRAPCISNDDFNGKG